MRTWTAREVRRRGHVPMPSGGADREAPSAANDWENAREGLGTEGRGRTASERRKPWPQELGAGRVDRAPFGDRTCTDPGGRTEAEIVADRSRGSMAIDSARKNGLLGRTNAEIGYIDAQAAKEALRPKITANAELDGSRARHCDGEDCPGLRGQVLPKYWSSRPWVLVLRGSLLWLKFGQRHFLKRRHFMKPTGYGRCRREIFQPRAVVTMCI